MEAAICPKCNILHGITNDAAEAFRFGLGSKWLECENCKNVVAQEKLIKKD